MDRNGTTQRRSASELRLALALSLALPCCQSDLHSALSAGGSTASSEPGEASDDAPPGDDVGDPGDDSAPPSDDDFPRDGDDRDGDDDVTEPTEDDDAPNEDDDADVSRGGASGETDDDLLEPEPIEDDLPEPETDPGDDDVPAPDPGDDDALDPGDDDALDPGDDDALDPGDDDFTGPAFDSGTPDAGEPSADDAGAIIDAGSDQCPADPEKTEPGACGCGFAETDGDGDDTPDCNDGCPLDGTKTDPGACGCGASEATGNDTIADCLDLSGALRHRYSFTGSGTTATDGAGDADGTVMGTTLTGSGSVNLSTGPYVDLPNDVLDGVVDATFEVWLSRGTLTDPFQRVFDFGDSGVEGETGNASSNVFLTPRTTPEKGNAVRFTFKNGVTPEVALTGPEQLPIDAASHVAAVLDDAGDRMLLYVDGVLVAQDDWPDALSEINAINNWIGRSQYVADPGFDGSIDEFRIYDVALDEEQIEYSIAAGPNPEFLD